MERVEDRSKALSYIGIEIADALKLIPTPVEEMAQIEEKAKVDVKAQQEVVKNVKVNTKVVAQNTVQPQAMNVQPQPVKEEQPKKVKSSLWNKIKNSKLVMAFKYAFKAKIVLQLPTGLPEGNSDNKQ